MSCAFDGIFCVLSLRHMHELVIFITVSVIVVTPVVFCESFYVDSSRGHDHKGCGTSGEQACQTMRYTFLIAEASSVEDLVDIILEAGRYDTASISLACSDKASRRQFTIRPNATLALGSVKIVDSLSIQGCDIRFINITFEPFHNDLGILHTFYFSQVSYIDSEINLLNITIICDSGSLIVERTVFSECHPIRPGMPLIVARSLGLWNKSSSISLQHCKFWSVQGSILNVQHLNTVVLAEIDIAHNIIEDTVTDALPSLQLNDVDDLTIQNVTIFRSLEMEISVDNCRHFEMHQLTLYSCSGRANGDMIKVARSNGTFIQSTFAKNTAKRPLLRFGSRSYVILKNCTFDCNDIDGKIGSNSVTVDDGAETHIKESVMTGCPLSCSAGEEAKDAVLCVPCLRGYYSSGCINGICSKCQRCEQGHFSPHRGSSSCSPCPAGMVCKSRGCIKCDPCKNDFFTSSLGSSSCRKPRPLFTGLVSVAVILILVPFIVIIVRRTVKRTAFLCCCFGLQHRTHHHLRSDSSLDIQECD